MEEGDEEWADPPMCVAAAMGIRGALEDEPRPSRAGAQGKRRDGRWLRFIGEKNTDMTMTMTRTSATTIIIRPTQEQFFLGKALV
jgi:hypothetical protein